MNDFIAQYKSVLKKYAVFTGRAGRREFWSFVLVNAIISILIGLLRMQALSAIYSLAVLIPGLAVGIRRLHDTNRSGWWLLIGFVPVIGTILLIVFVAQQSQPGSNRFGSGAGASAAAASAPSEPMASSSPTTA